MLEILKFMVSGFWVFVGCTIIMYMVFDTGIELFKRFTITLLVLIKGYPPRFSEAIDEMIDDDVHEEQ